jgi:IS5 family transposase
MKRRTIAPGQLGFFTYQDWAENLAQSPTTLDRLNEIINFESFRRTLENVLPPASPHGGRPSYDAVFMFKVLILQRLHGQLSDEQTEFQIRDRFSFQRFLGLTIADHMPDANTIRNYREIWSHSNTIEKCFEHYLQQLAEVGLMEEPGKIVDATFVEVPIQRNTREENAHIKEHGTAPDGWSGNVHKCAQKDTDARWTKKNHTPYYGYKCHALVDSMSKLIEGYYVTAANVHDSQVFTDLLRTGDTVYADSAYKSAGIDEELQDMHVTGHICEKGTRKNALTQTQKNTNTIMSKIRVRVEHVFGDMTNSMNAMYIRSIGIIRAAGIIGLNNIAYNMRRFEQIVRLNLIKLS